MSGISVPGAGFGAYSMFEWWEETRKFVDQRTKFRSQVDDISITTTAVNMDLTYDDTGILITNPGDITLPLAEGFKGKFFYFIFRDNPNILAANWVGQNVNLLPRAGDTVVYRSSLRIARGVGGVSRVIAKSSFFLLSDGESNWIGYA